MNPWIRSLACFALLASPSAFAQQNVLLSENFKNGLPANWQVSQSPSFTWHVAASGECGAVTSMLAYNRGPAACDYASGGSHAGSLQLPLLLFTGQPPIKLAFDYILDIDATGDSIALFVLNTTSQLIGFASHANLVNDGALHSIVLDAPAVFAGPVSLSYQLYIVIETDGIGDQGRGFMIDNVVVTSTNAGAVMCNGGQASSCPCANGSGLLQGCTNSTGSGAGLSAIGIASLSADTLRLEATNMPPSTSAVWFQGTAQVSASFGNGRRCAGGTVVRLGTKSAPNGTAVLPGPAEPSISSHSQISLGAVRFYQVMYRDAAGPCGQAFNLSNGLLMAWRP